MKIGLFQVDGMRYHNVPFPNIALMKISSYHKSIGDSVEWYKGLLWAHTYDKIYASKIFDFSPMPDITENMIIGGTGIDFYNNLPSEIENAPMDWDIYPNTPFHYGFSMKGCRFNEKTCPWCCVPKKEGKPRKYNSIDELLTNPSGGKKLILLDNDFFGNPDWQISLERIIELDLKVCFVQGLNIRIISDNQAKLLAKCKYYNSKFSKRYLTFAWDRTEDEKAIYRGIERLNKHGIPANHLQFFVLIGAGSSPSEDEHRVESIRQLGAMPFVMPYDKNDIYQKAYTRYVNNRIIFNSCKWENYKYNPFTQPNHYPRIKRC